MNHIRKTNGKWVLVVEDDTDLRMAVSLLLQEQHIKVLGAANGLEAIRIMSNALHEDHLPSIILLDLNMPLFNGWDLLYLVEVAQPKIQEIPIVVTSGEHIPRLDPRYRNIKKPYTSEQIMTEVRRVIPE